MLTHIDVDETVSIRWGRLCTLVMAAIKYGNDDREMVVDELAAKKAGEFLAELQHRGEIKPNTKSN